MAYCDSKDLAKRTISGKVKKKKKKKKKNAYEIARNHKCYGYQRALESMVYKLFNKKTELGLSVASSWRIT